MSGKVINLRQARKNQQRAEKETVAAANREKFGRTKAQKTIEKSAGDKAKTHLDGHKLDD